MIYDKVKKILIEQLDVDETLISMDADIIEDLHTTSLDIIDLAIMLEDEFDIEIPGEAIEEIHTIGDIVKYIKRST